MSSENEQGGEPGKRFALWGARFREGGLAPEAEALNRSLPVDRRLWREEIEVAAAWIEGLARLGALTADEARTLERGLERVGERLAAGAAEDALDEDIHTLVERLLVDEVGDLGGKLRTGRSRNDQAATATRLWVTRACDAISRDITRLQQALVSQAESTVDTLAPSYTHLQRAQPIRLAHFFLSHFWPLQRDRERWADVRRRAAVLPLGAGAVAGSGFAVDRELIRECLGFASIAPNSMDAVSDRDFVAEFSFAAALTGAHLSRLAEDLILFSSAEFGFVRFSEAYSTGSSFMPQKRNPDIAELARGQSARLLGDATAALALLKANPTGYNKDLQEDKTIIFSCHDTLRKLLPPFAGAVDTLEVLGSPLAAALDASMLAVDVADALARAGVTFREAHAAVGALVREAEAAGVSILEVDLPRVAALHPGLPDALRAISGAGASEAFERSIEAKCVMGGTARPSVEAQLAAARAAVSDRA